MHHTLNRMPDIKDAVAGGADKKPFRNITHFSEHGMKPIPVSARGADFKLIIHVQTLNLIIHFCSFSFCCDFVLFLRNK